MSNLNISEIVKECYDTLRHHSKKSNNALPWEHTRMLRLMEDDMLPQSPETVYPSIFRYGGGSRCLHKCFFCSELVGIDPSNVTTNIKKFSFLPGYNVSICNTCLQA
jgi:hypothetical protein